MSDPPTRQAAAQPPGTLAECIERLAATTAILRAPGGCPWDRRQTHQSLRSALIEECYEVVEAIDSRSPQHLREELGDLLRHTLIHSQIAAENDECTLEQVMRELHDKLVRRHPHVFGDQRADDPESVVRLWESVKSAEKSERTSAMDGIPPAMPSLMRAEKAGKKAARAGFDWPGAAGVIEKIREEADEIEEALGRGDQAAAAGEVGDLLFTVANLSRHLKCEGELLLHQATDKFIRRFRALEARLAASGRSPDDCTPGELESLWREIKSEEAASTAGAGTH